MIWWIKRSMQTLLPGNYRTLLRTLRSLPHNYIFFRPNDPNYTMLEITDAFLKALGFTRDQIVGKGLFEVFPDNPASEIKNEAVLLASLRNVLATGNPDAMPTVRYDIPIPGSDQFEVRYWRPENFPLLNRRGKVILIMHTAFDLTGYSKYMKEKGIQI